MRAPHIVGLAAAAALAISGCVANAPAPQPAPSSPGSSGAPSPSADTTGAAGVLTVASTDTECTVSANSVASGTTTFQIANQGGRITEFYLLGSDGLRIVAEKENIAPGSTSELVVSLQPGAYFTACKPGMRGANVGEAAFTVTGEPIALSADDQELFDGVVTAYINFVKNEVAELVPQVETFVDDYTNGRDDAARALYAVMRVHYERIEPIAETLGVLDPRIDYREIDYLAEAELLAGDDPTFTEWLGFHRIEKDLWPPAEGDVQPDGSSALEGWAPSTPEQRLMIGAALLEDVQTLYDTVHSETFIADQQIDVATVANGAAGLLEEIAVGKVTGEENWWSHYDLWDFQANLQGARIAFDLVAPIAERKGAEGADLVAEINKQFDALQALLDRYGNLDEGYVLYDTVTREQQRELTDQIDALREPLSKLTGAVLGIA